MEIIGVIIAGIIIGLLGVTVVISLLLPKKHATAREHPQFLTVSS